ncbi:group II intron maturase-specific domain-containing protein, partial [Acidovorax sp.]|uniref:group II intron maturase-specific domain-containing protein n=1 Tax=Acidovorax sp. TaxID=1872122 RepID=UPI002587CD49
ARLRIAAAPPCPLMRWSSSCVAFMLLVDMLCLTHKVSDRLKYSGKMLIKPNHKNVQAFYGKVQETIATSLALPTETLIKRLNPILKGWARYHQGVVAKATFSKLDHQIFWRLMRWGHRRHPRKTRQWIYDHYWDNSGTRRQFAGTDVDRWDEKVQVRLYQLADTKIVRHVKVKGDYNPFDPAWEAYGEKLRRDRIDKTIWDYERLTLWMQQDGFCALCQQEIDAAGEDCEDHHILYRRLGGSDALSNRVLMHSVCHRRVHALGLEVTKPAPARGL